MRFCRTKSIKKKIYKKFREALSFCSKCGGTMQVKIHSNVYPFSRWDIDQDFSKSHLVYNDVELLPRAHGTALPPNRLWYWVYWNESRNEHVFCEIKRIGGLKVDMLSRPPARHPTIKHFASLKVSRRPAEVVWNLLWATAIPISWTGSRQVLFGERCPVSPLELVEFCFLRFICRVKIVIWESWDLKGNPQVYQIHRSKFPAGGESRFHQHSFDEHSSTQLHLTLCGSGQHFRTRWRMDMRCTTSKVSVKRNEHNLWTSLWFQIIVMRYLSMRVPKCWDCIEKVRCSCPCESDGALLRLSLCQSRQLRAVWRQRVGKMVAASMKERPCECARLLGGSHGGLRSSVGGRCNSRAWSFPNFHLGMEPSH